MANVLGELFGAIASAIREKTGDAEKMKPAQFPEKIGKLADTSGVTATAYDVLSGKVFVDAEGKIVDGAISNTTSEPISETLTAENPRYLSGAIYIRNTLEVKIVPEDKTVVPTSEEQTITADDGKVLGSVIVEPVSAPFFDVSGVDATASDVAPGKKFIDADGNMVDGTMPTLSGNTISLTPSHPYSNLMKGYSDGTCVFNVSYKNETVTPTKETQTIKDTAKFIKELTVNSIPDEYQNVSNVTATAEDVKAGKVFVDSEGNEVEGAMSGTLADVSVVTAKSEDVLEGKVIVDSTGYAVTGTLSMASTGGGGSLPAGAYWMQKVYPPYITATEYFPFGNTEYYFAKPSSSSTTYNLYDYADGAYNLIYSGIERGTGQHLEYNGKIHGIGYNALHYVYNGSTLTKLNDIPGESLGNGHINRFVWNDNLYVYAKNKLYVWDEATDTWTDTGMINRTITYNQGHCFIYNDTLYRYYLKNLYKYVDGVETTVKTFDISFTLETTYKETIYFKYLNQVYSYNIETDTLKYIGVGAGGTNNCYSTADGKIIAFGTSFQHYQLYEITE